MAIRPKDRDLVAYLASSYIEANIVRGRQDVSLDEGVVYAVKLLTVIDRHLPNNERKSSRK